MRRSVIAHLLSRKPFKAFRIVVSTDEAFEVKHPEAAFLAKRFMAIARSSAESFRDDSSEMVWIDYRHIAYCQPISKREIPF